MLWPLVVYSALVVALAAAMIVISYFLGEKHKERVTDEPYESGIVGTESARLRFSVKFYLIAMFFVIFDVESIFIFALGDRVSGRSAGRDMSLCLYL